MIKWAVAKVWNDGGQQAIPMHRVFSSRYNTPEEAIKAMKSKSIRDLMPGNYYVRSIE